MTGTITGGTLSGATITGGSLNSCIIGATTPSSATFTNLTVSGTLSASVNGNTTSVTSTGSTTSRNLSERFNDWQNAKDWGCVLNGSTNDLTAFQALYNATPNNGIITIPDGSGLSGGNYTSASNKSVLWQALGTLDYGTASPGTSPVTSLGDGDVLEAFIGGRKRFSKSITTATNNSAYATVEIDSTWAGNGGVNSALAVNAINNSTQASGGLSGIISTLSVTGSNGSGLNIGVWSLTAVRKSATASGWAYYGEVQDRAGTASITSCEFDIYTRGSDPITGQYPGNGLRSLLTLNSGLCSVSATTASASTASTTIVVDDTSDISTGMIISGAGVSGSPTVSSITNSTTLVASSSQTIGSGVSLIFTSPSAQVSRGVSVGGGNGGWVGSAFFITAPLYWSAFDCSCSTFENSSTASLRMGPNQPIDFSAVAGTSSSINKRTLQYNSTDTALEYAVSSTILMSVADSGATTVNGPLYMTSNSNGAIPNNVSGAAITWNYSSGQAEVDFWNCYSAPGQSFAWYQRTSVPGANLMMSLDTTNGLIVGNTYLGVQTRSWTDPDSGVPRDAKFGNHGIAVVGGTKTDTLVVTGTATGTTPTAGDSSTKFATTAFVANAVSSGGTYTASSVAITGGTINGTSVGATTASTGAFTTLTASSTVSGSGFTTLLSPYALLASPALTGTPTAPTATSATNTTQIATTAYVQANLSSYLTTSSATSTYAPLASPALTGTPTAPTAASTVNTTQVATTAYAFSRTNSATWSLQWTNGIIVVAGTSYFTIRAPYAGTIASMDWFCGTGSFTANVKIGATSVTSLSAVNVNTATQTNTAATGANTFAVGDIISVAITSPTSSPTNAVLSLRITRT